MTRTVLIVFILCALLLSFVSAVQAIGIGTASCVPGFHHRYVVKPKHVRVVDYLRINLNHRANKLTAHGHKSTKHQLCLKNVPLPQNLVDKLSYKLVAPGVVYRHYQGLLSLNIIDADLLNGSVAVRPMIAGDNFNRLANVKNHAQHMKAIAAVNANYFKHDGTPLGTLIINQEWIAGPLYDRVSMGITRCGYVRMDRVSLNGILTTSNEAVKTTWVNNINQPRRSGSRLIVYTRRWGNQVKMAYSGALVAVDNCGQVVSKAQTLIDIPPGGYALSDSKCGAIAKLNVGDHVSLSWQTTPNDWGDVVHAVSGGPRLIKDGQLYLDLKDEVFKSAWTGKQIKARTAIGVTANNHLLLVTVEGPHSLWDMAKLLKKLGAIDAMNLDGGGSTTMVVNGTTVTRNGSSYQRRVASSLAIIPAVSATSQAAENKQFGVMHTNPRSELAEDKQASDQDSLKLNGNKDLLAVPGKS